MKSITATKRILTMLLSVLLLASAVPFAAAAETETAFVSENLLRKEGVIDLENSSPIQFYANLWVNKDTTKNIFDYHTTRVEAQVLPGAIDGDKTTEAAFSAWNSTSPNWLGLLYKLNETTYCDSAVVFAGIESIPDCYRVYTGDSLDTLFLGKNMRQIICRGEKDGIKVELHKNVQYIAIVFDSPSSSELVENSTYARLKEIELWSGDPANDFIPENLLLSDKTIDARPVKMAVDTGTVTDYPGNALKAETVFAGQSGIVHTDIYQENGFNSGFQFTFSQPEYIGEILLDAGTWNYDETYEIYASNDIKTLYSEKSRLVSGIECKYAGGKRIKINKYYQYLAIFQTATAVHGMRIRQIAIYTADSTGVEIPDIFVSENALQTKLEKAEPIVQYVSNGNFNDEAAITADKIAAMTDSDTKNHVDLPASLNWPDAPRKVGVRFTLLESLYIGEIKLYAGYETYPETYSVYASDTLETLYSSKNKIADNERATENSIIIANADKNVKYIAFICESYGGNPRFKEIEAWTADPREAFVSENLLQTDLAEKSTFHMFVSNGSVTEGNMFDKNGALDISVDGDTATTAPVYDCTFDGRDYPIYPGARYTLNNTAYTDSLTVYANGKIKVYASDALDTLYAQYNCIVSEAPVSLTGTKIEIKNNVKYLAVFCIGYADIAEIELWSGDPNAKPEEPEDPIPTSLKVLTIGNSFAENASIYASEIAKINGKDLTFGYLKFPSCTIDQHYQAATENLAVFKFQITYPDGSKTTVKNEASWNNPDPATSATVAEALEYYDWDVIVFQQESNNARTLSTYSNLGNLIEFVKGYCPDAKLAIHEVWRWGIWSYDDYLSIKNNTAAVAEQYSLDIIPSGAAFENARTALKSDTIVNDNDSGNYQHANGYGQYLAGCVYTGALFGIEISETTFASHPAVTNAETAAILTKAANDAVAEYYPGEVEYPLGDLNLDGQVNAEDLAFMRQMLIGIECGTDANVDLNNDNSFDIKDYIRLKKIIAGLA